MRNIQISEKLILYFVVMGISLISIIGSYAYYTSKQALLSRTFDQLTSLRLEKKNRIEQFFIDRRNDIKLISKSEEIKQIIKILDEHPSNSHYVKSLNLNSYLQQYISTIHYYQRLYVTNSHNKVIDINSSDSSFLNSSSADSSCSFELRKFCEKIRLSGKIEIKDLSKSQLLIYLGTPVFDYQNKIIGLIVAEIPISAINKIMYGYPEGSGLGKSGETYLVGADTLMRSNSRFSENAILNIKVSTKAVKAALRGKTETSLIEDYRNIRCLSSYSPVEIEGLRWLLLAEIDEKEAMISVYKIRNSILFISIIIAAIVFVFALVISRRITSPIKKLKNASQEIAKGNYAIQLPIESLDEIGNLTKTFNEMCYELQQQKDLIQQERKKGLNSLIDGQEMERQRLSRDLHDGLGQSLLAVKIKLQQLNDTDSDKSKKLLIEIQELLSNTISEIRHISNDLMPPVLQVFGLHDALKTLCKETGETTGILIDFYIEKPEEILSDRYNIFIYRIVQEVFNNMVKHSMATKASLEILKDKNDISIHISDNGNGFNVVEAERKGHGLFNIHQRVNLLEGKLSIKSEEKHGTFISINLPII